MNRRDGGVPRLEDARPTRSAAAKLVLGVVQRLHAKTKRRNGGTARLRRALVVHGEVERADVAEVGHPVERDRRRGGA